MKNWSLFGEGPNKAQNAEKMRLKAINFHCLQRSNERSKVKVTPIGINRGQRVKSSIQ